LLANFILFLAGFDVARIPGALSAGVGSSLIAAGVTGWVIYVYILVSERRVAILETVSEFGLVDIFEARAVLIKRQYDDRLSKAHVQIDIMGFGLKALREDYADQFQAWGARANVRILLIDPSSPNPLCSYAQQRDVEEADPPGTIKKDVDQFIEKMRTLRIKSPGHKFEVRLYKCLPSVNIFRIDDELFWGPYLIHQQSRKTPTLLVRRGGLLYDQFLEHFERIWNDNTLSTPMNP
jgi:hypothetical protein